MLSQRLLPLPVFLALSLLATACQTVPSQQGAGARAATGNAGLDRIPDCAADASATLAEGVRIGYLGSDPSDPQRCLLRWADRMHALYFGFWSTGPEAPMSDEARAAVRAALTGPVGTEASFQTADARLWDRVTITHVANTVVLVAGQRRPALELRVVRHDALGRPDVRAETRYAIDRATGVMLRSEDVTPMADGGVTKTLGWQIANLTASG
jgi:hypothetical protein